MIVAAIEDPRNAGIEVPLSLAPRALLHLHHVKPVPRNMLDVGREVLPVTRMPGQS
jgi:hypothetical protein